MILQRWERKMSPKIVLALYLGILHKGEEIQVEPEVSLNGRDGTVSREVKVTRAS